METQREQEDQLGLRARQRRMRDAAILQAAFDLIAEHGYEAMTMEGLAERVGISRPTLYHHFSCKEDIALRAIITLVEQGIQTIREIDPALPPIARLERVIRWMLERRFSPELAAFVRAKPSLVPLKTHPDYRRVFERRMEVMAQIVEAAQAAGEIRADLASRFIVEMLLGLVSEARYDDLITGAVATPTEITEAVTEFVMRGLSPGGKA